MECGIARIQEKRAEIENYILFSMEKKKKLMICIAQFDRKFPGHQTIPAACPQRQNTKFDDYSENKCGREM